MGKIKFAGFAAKYYIVTICRIRAMRFIAGLILSVSLIITHNNSIELLATAFATVPAVEAIIK
jgi:hypothetical protein